MRVWVARAEPGASATADRLRALGHAPLVAPILRVVPVPFAVPELADVGALAFTSRQAVDAWAAASSRRDFRVHAVGSATAAAAARAGFADVRSADAGVEALAAAILADPPPGVVLHPRAEEPAGDLKGLFQAGGLTARDLVVYRTEAVPPPETVAAFAPDAVLVHSPKAARALAQALPAAVASTMRAYALSENCAAALQGAGFASVAIADTPDDATLLALLPGPGAEGAPPRLMGPAFWIALVFGLFCILAGAAVAVFAPGLGG